MRKTTPTFPSPTRRLTIFYICALSSVALLAIMGQTIVQIAIGQQADDANIINIAGRQRMLSQKISKDALILEVTNDETTRRARGTELQQALTNWESSQRGLQQGDAAQKLPGHNSVGIQRLYNNIEPDYQAMVNATQRVLTLEQQEAPTESQRAALGSSTQTILLHEEGFLTAMDQIVLQYQHEAEGRITMLRIIELTILGVLLVVLLLEGLLIFRPTERRLNRTIREMTELESSIAKQKRELEEGIAQILQTHVQTANRNFAVRAPLNQDHILWQIAYSLNNLIARLQRLAQAEVELQQMKMEARHTIGALQQQAGQIQTELRSIQTEAMSLVEMLRAAKAKGQPVPTVTSRTLLDPLYRELVGTSVRPALPPPSR